MKTLQEIKDEYAKSKGFDKFTSLPYYKIYDELVDDICKVVARESLVNADKRVGMFPNYRNLVADKILNEENIPK